MNLDSYATIDFPLKNKIVYIVGISSDNNFIPFYVGSSDRHIGRLGDYISANFSAPTDFKIGEAVKYLIKKGHRVIVKYREIENHKEKEKEIINKLREKYLLLNDLKGYNYKKANKEKEIQKIYEFIKGL